MTNEPKDNPKLRQTAEHFRRVGQRRAREQDAKRCPDCGGALVQADGVDRCPVCGWTRRVA